MSTTYSPTPTLVTDITIPQDGDNGNAASVNVSSTKLADMTEFLYRSYGNMMQSTSPIIVTDNADAP